MQVPWYLWHTEVMLSQASQLPQEGCGAFTSGIKKGHLKVAFQN
jgi:hypothetical protein